MWLVISTPEKNRKKKQRLTLGGATTGHQLSMAQVLGVQHLFGWGG
jgi:hypothetical protein